MLLSALAAFIAANIAVLALGFTRVMPRRLSELTSEQIAIIGVVQDLTLVAVLLLLLRRWPKLTPADLGVTSPVAVRRGLLTAGALWLLSLVIANLQQVVIGSQRQALVIAAVRDRSIEALALNLAIGGAFVGAVEELFFRAVLFAALRQRMRFVYAALISSALFALAHVELAALLPAFALGLGFAWLYEKRRSLWTNALAHGTVNALTFVIIFFGAGAAAAR